MNETTAKEIKDFYIKKADYLLSVVQLYTSEPPFTQDYKFAIAGGCMAAGKVNDIDIFPIRDNPVIPFLRERVVSETRNAVTLSGHRYPIQLCHYRHPTLADLVESFDFSHIQIGVACTLRESGMLTADEVYYSNGFVKANMLGSTEYTHSKYPLSSLIRMNKYMERGNLSPHRHVSTTIAILKDIVKRGYTSYNDFKDQLDAVDLGLLPEDFKDLDREDLKELFELLRKDK